jgi:hypothetical protein
MRFVSDDGHDVIVTLLAEPFREIAWMVVGRQRFDGLDGTDVEDVSNDARCFGGSYIRARGKDVRPPRQAPETSRVASHAASAEIGERTLTVRLAGPGKGIAILGDGVTDDEELHEWHGFVTRPQSLRTPATQRGAE